MNLELRIHLRVNLSFQSGILFTLANTSGMVRGVIRAIDLFSGAGGLSLGFELAGVEVLAAVEYCDKAVTTYKRNFPEHLTYCIDIKQLKTDKVVADLKKKGYERSDIDLIIGGPPCPGFSNIGRSKIVSLLRNKDWKWKGRPPKEWRHQFIQDPRNKLFLEFVRFVEDFQPRGYVMENVTGMLSSKNSEGVVITDLIKDAFKNIGYECEIKVLEADKLGVPQARKRVIFIGWKTDRPEDAFPHPTMSNQFKWTSIDAISDLPYISQEGGFSNESHGKSKNEYQTLMRYKAYRDANRVDPRTGKVPTKKAQLSCHKGRWVNPRDRAIFPELEVPVNGPRVTYDKIKPEKLNFPDGWSWDSKQQLVINSTIKKGRNSYKWYRTDSFKDKIRRIASHKPCPTLVAHMATDTYMYVHPSEDRTITPQEAARIQSFPDSFDFSLVSFTSQYRQIGNAVPPFMAKAIAENIIQAWK